MAERITHIDDGEQSPYRHSPTSTEVLIRPDGRWIPGLPGITPLQRGTSITAQQTHTRLEVSLPKNGNVTFERYTQTVTARRDHPLDTRRASMSRRLRLATIPPLFLLVLLGGQKIFREGRVDGAISPAAITASAPPEMGCKAVDRGEGFLQTAADGGINTNQPTYYGRPGVPPTEVPPDTAPETVHEGFLICGELLPTSNQ